MVKMETQVPQMSLTSNLEEASSLHDQAEKRSSIAF